MVHLRAPGTIGLNTRRWTGVPPAATAPEPRGLGCACSLHGPVRFLACSDGVSGVRPLTADSHPTPPTGGGGRDALEGGRGGATPPLHGPHRMGLDRGPPPLGFASADTPPGEGAIRMGQRYQVLHTWSCGGCDVLWQASPVSRPADLVLWSSGSALTSCIMSRTVHHCPWASDAVAQSGTCSTATACG